MIGEGRMRHTKGGSVPIPVSMERDQDGSLSTGAIIGIVVAAFSGLFCLCSLCSKCLGNDEEEDQDQAKMESPGAVELGARNEPKSLDDVRIHATIQMALVNKSNITDKEICVVQKLYASTAITSQDIMDQVNEYKNTRGSIQQDLSSFEVPLTFQQNDGILIAMICVALVHGNL
jgi:hypothetical protein